MVKICKNSNIYLRKATNFCLFFFKKDIFLCIEQTSKIIKLTRIFFFVY